MSGHVTPCRETGNFAQPQSVYLAYMLHDLISKLTRSHEDVTFNAAFKPLKRRNNILQMFAKGYSFTHWVCVAPEICYHVKLWESFFPFPQNTSLLNIYIDSKILH